MESIFFLSFFFSFNQDSGVFVVGRTEKSMIFKVHGCGASTVEYILREKN